MILWLPISLILGFCGAVLLLSVSEMYSAELSELGISEELSDKWKRAVRFIGSAIISLLAAVLLTGCYLLAKMSLGL